PVPFCLLLPLETSHTPSDTSLHFMVATLSLRCAVKRSIFTRSPNVPSALFHTNRNLIVTKNTVPSSLLGTGPSHTSDDGRVVIVVPSCIPVRDTTKQGQNLVGRNWTRAVFYLVQQCSNLAPFDGGEVSAAP